MDSWNIFLLRPGLFSGGMFSGVWTKYQVGWSWLYNLVIKVWIQIMEHALQTFETDLTSSGESKYIQPEIIVSIKPHNYVKKSIIANCLVENKSHPLLNWKEGRDFAVENESHHDVSREKKTNKQKTSDWLYPELGAKAPGQQPWYHLQWFRWPAKGHNPIDVQMRPFLNQPLKASISTLMIYNTVLNTHTHT